MSSTLSLNASIRTCKVDAGWANRTQSDRFLNPNNMVCIPWDGYNLKGQRVCPDSHYTKTPGCNSALDRIAVENVLRPQYSAYVSLDAAGIALAYPGQKNNMEHRDTMNRIKKGKQLESFIPQYSNKVLSGSWKNTCSVENYERAMAQMAEAQRAQGYAQEGFKGYEARDLSGMY